MVSKSPIRVFEHVKDAFRRYYDSQFWLKDDPLMEERANLLETDKVYFRDPLLEVVSLTPQMYRLKHFPRRWACRKLTVNDW